MRRPTCDPLRQQRGISNYQMRMYHSRLDDRPIGRASQQRCADDSVAFDFQSSDPFHRLRHKLGHPSIVQPLKIARIFDRQAHVLVLKSMQNDELAPHSAFVKLAMQTQMFCPI